MPKLSSKNQVTIPVSALQEAGLRAGDELVVQSAADGEIVLAARGSRVRRYAGVGDGVYERDELLRLRREWEH
jgi:bifunctional DNA-binding transcriptional regulator/antitoxin component of YhaV-PrlF toxin-antitoxin module